MLGYLLMLEGKEEKASFEKIYTENYLKMYHVAFSMLKQQSDAENAVHDAFLSIAEHFKRYSVLSSKEMTGMCIIIVKNKAIDQLRNQRCYSDEELENIVLINEFKNYEPTRYIIDKEESEQLRKMMEQLPETLKITLDLKYFYDYSNREISQILNVSVKTIEMRLYRAKIKMKELLEYEKRH